MSLESPVLADRFFATAPLGKPPFFKKNNNFIYFWLSGSLLLHGLFSSSELELFHSCGVLASVVAA